MESRYDSNRAVGKYFFGRKEPRKRGSSPSGPRVLSMELKVRDVKNLEDDFVTRNVR